MMAVLFLPRPPGYESEEVGADLTCVLPVLTGACSIANEVGGTLTSREAVGIVLQAPVSLACENHYLQSRPLCCLREKPAC